MRAADQQRRRAGGGEGARSPVSPATARGVGAGEGTDGDARRPAPDGGVGRGSTSLFFLVVPREHESAAGERRRIVGQPS